MMMRTQRTTLASLRIKLLDLHVVTTQKSTSLSMQTPQIQVAMTTGLGTKSTTAYVVAALAKVGDLHALVKYLSLQSAGVTMIKVAKAGKLKLQPCAFVTD